MIIKTILDALQAVIFAVFSWLDLPNLSDYGLDIDAARSTIMEIFTMCTSVIDMLLPWSIVKLCLPIVIAVSNADKIYKFLMWILRKIPMLGIK
mgnify:CR=1 FL=1